MPIAGWVRLSTCAARIPSSVKLGGILMATMTDGALDGWWQPPSGHRQVHRVRLGLPDAYRKGGGQPARLQCGRPDSVCEIAQLSLRGRQLQPSR
jgi:hypothetical protein